MISVCFFCIITQNWEKTQQRHSKNRRFTNKASVIHLEYKILYFGHGILVIVLIYFSIQNFIRYILHSRWQLLRS